MKIVWKILGVIAGILVLTLVLIYALGFGYILKGIRVTYLQGHQTAYLSDYRFFDNHTIRHGAGQPWPMAKSENRFTLPDSLRQFHEDARSVAYMIIQRDSIVLEEYFDGYGPDSKSNSFSMAKSMVAAILGRVIMDGSIVSLDQKVVHFVPELQGQYAADLSFRDLVSMSSGMEWEESYYNPFSVTTQLYFDKNIQQVMAKLPIYKQPGLEFIYQSGDTQLLGIAIHRATGRTLSELLSDYFWKPIGAEQDALWQVDSEQYGIEKAYCCVASNARDFARFGKLYRDKGLWNGQQVLDSTYVEASLQPRFENSPQYGFGWWLGQFEGKPYFYMDGHLGQYVITIPEDDLIIVRLGHQTDTLKRSDPASNFQHFIRHAYALLKLE